MDPLRMGGGGLDGRGQDRSVGLEDEIDMVVRQVFGSLDATNATSIVPAAGDAGSPIPSGGGGIFLGPSPDDLIDMDFAFLGPAADPGAPASYGLGDFGVGPLGSLAGVDPTAALATVDPLTAGGLAVDTGSVSDSRYYGEDVSSGAASITATSVGGSGGGGDGGSLSAASDFESMFGISATTTQGLIFEPVTITVESPAWMLADVEKRFRCSSHPDRGKADPFCFAVTYDKRVVAGPPRVDVRGSFRKAIDKPVFADIPLIRSPVVEVEVDASEDTNGSTVTLRYTLTFCQGPTVVLKKLQVAHPRTRTFQVLFSILVTPSGAPPREHVCSDWIPVFNRPKRSHASAGTAKAKAGGKKREGGGRERSTSTSSAADNTSGGLSKGNSVADLVAAAAPVLGASTQRVRSESAGSSMAGDVASLLSGGLGSPATAAFAAIGAHDDVHGGTAPGSEAPFYDHDAGGGAQWGTTAGRQPPRKKRRRSLTDDDDGMFAVASTPATGHQIRPASPATSGRLVDMARKSEPQTPHPFEMRLDPAVGPFEGNTRIELLLSTDLSFDLGAFCPVMIFSYGEASMRVAMFGGDGRYFVMTPPLESLRGNGGFVADDDPLEETEVVVDVCIPFVYDVMSASTFTYLDVHSESSRMIARLNDALARDSPDERMLARFVTWLRVLLPDGGGGEGGSDGVGSGAYLASLMGNRAALGSAVIEFVGMLLDEGVPPVMLLVTNARQFSVAHFCAACGLTEALARIAAVAPVDGLNACLPRLIELARDHGHGDTAEWLTGGLEAVLEARIAAHDAVDGAVPPLTAREGMEAARSIGSTAAGVGDTASSSSYGEAGGGTATASSASSSPGTSPLPGSRLAGLARETPSGASSPDSDCDPTELFSTAPAALVVVRSSPGPVALTGGTASPSAGSAVANGAGPEAGMASAMADRQSHNDQLKAQVAALRAEQAQMRTRLAQLRARKAAEARVFANDSAATPDEELSGGAAAGGPQPGPDADLTDTGDDATPSDTADGNGSMSAGVVEAEEEAEEAEDAAEEAAEAAAVLNHLAELTGERQAVYGSAKAAIGELVEAKRATAAQIERLRQSKPPSPEVRRLRAHVVELARDVEHWQEELGANAAALAHASALSVDNDQLKARVADASRTVDATAAALSRARAADESAANDVALLRSKLLEMEALTGALRDQLDGSPGDALEAAAMGSTTTTTAEYGAEADDAMEERMAAEAARENALLRAEMAAEMERQAVLMAQFSGDTAAGGSSDVGAAAVANADHNDDDDDDDDLAALRLQVGGHRAQVEAMESDLEARTAELERVRSRLDGLEATRISLEAENLGAAALAAAIEQGILAKEAEAAEVQRAFDDAARDRDALRDTFVMLQTRLSEARSVSGSNASIVDAIADVQAENMALQRRVAQLEMARKRRRMAKRPASSGFSKAAAAAAAHSAQADAMVPRGSPVEGLASSETDSIGTA